MKRHIYRALRYFVGVAIMIALLETIMYYAGSTGSRESIVALLYNWRIWALLGALMLISALQPIWGYTTRTVRADINADRERIFDAMLPAGYSLKQDTAREMIFRKASPLVRLVSFDDRITITAESDGYVNIEGARKAVMKCEWALNRTN